MFEKATRKKYRFNTSFGVLNTEDLWTLKLEALDSLGISLRDEVEATKTDSFIKVKKINTEISDKLELVKYIIETRLVELDEAKTAMANKERRDKILRVLETKKEDSLLSMTEEELEAELKKL